MDLEFGGTLEGFWMRVDSLYLPPLGLASHGP
uniref:Uncharacterized protein n=1 Tax=Setaria italica TaxID=4555 RepID=K3XTV1_SETIT